MKFYNIEIFYKPLKDALCKYLKLHNIYYELSGLCDGWHFEILTNAPGASNIDNYIDNFTEVIA